MEDRIIKNRDTIKAFHGHLNHIYTRANNDYKDLLNRRFVCQLDFFKENYLQVDGQYELQHYPIPIITVKETGDIGYNLDRAFFEFSFEKSDFLSKDLSYLIHHFDSLEIYGGHNCLVDFYQNGDTPEMIRNKIHESDEQNIMLALSFDYCYDGLIDTFIEVAKTLGK